VVRGWVTNCTRSHLVIIQVSVALSLCPWSPSSSSRVGQGGKRREPQHQIADILREIVCLLTQRVRAGRATFLIKVKSHRGEPIIERADTLRRMDGKCPMTTQGGKTGRIGLRSRCRKGTRQHVQCGRTVCATPSGNKRGGLGQEQQQPSTGQDECTAIVVSPQLTLDAVIVNPFLSTNNGTSQLNDRGSYPEPRIVPWSKIFLVKSQFNLCIGTIVNAT